MSQFVGTYDVEVEYLDESGNVFDSHCVMTADDYDVALAEAEKVELTSPNTQVAIWEWDTENDMVVDSYIIKEY